MSRARDFADLAGSADAGGLTGRNLIINGAMNVAQRGTSHTAIHTTGYYAADRFQIIYSAEDELRNTITQASDGPDGFANSLKIQTTTAESAVASDERFYVIYKAEGQDLQQLGYGTSAAKSITVSFYVKSSVTGTYAFSLYQEDGNDSIGSTYTINSADTWEKKTLTFAGNTAAAIADDNTNGLAFYWGLMIGSDWLGTDNTSWGEWSATKFFHGHAQNGVGTTTNATWQLTGVQIELGEQATPFEHRSFGDELLQCQRYYHKNGSASFHNYTYQYNSTNRMMEFRHPVDMRASPTATVTFSSGSFSAFSPDNKQYKAYVAAGTSDSSAYYSTAYEFDAEL